MGVTENAAQDCSSALARAERRGSSSPAAPCVSGQQQGWHAAHRLLLINTLFSQVETLCTSEVWLRFAMLVATVASFVPEVPKGTPCINTLAFTNTCRARYTHRGFETSLPLPSLASAILTAPGGHKP